MTVIETALAQAAKTVPCYWPLTSFIAYHPLWEMHAQDFPTAIASLQRVAPVEALASVADYQAAYTRGLITEEGIAQACELLQQPYHPGVIGKQLAQLSDKALAAPHFPYSTHWTVAQNGKYADTIRSELINFLAPFFTSLSLPLAPERKESLWEAWLSYLAVTDVKHAQFASHLQGSTTLDTLVAALTALGVAAEYWRDYLASIFHQVIGYAALMKWLNQNPQNPFITVHAPLEQLLAIWLSYECFVLARHPKFANRAAAKPKTSDATWPLRYLLQCAVEFSYQHRLLAQLSARRALPVAPTPLAQWVFCIDTRSEGIRRHLESVGPYQTFGFAGFFGFVFTLQNQACLDQIHCPALFGPEAVLQVQQSPRALRQAVAETMQQTLLTTQKSPVAAWAFVELLGVWYGLAMFTKSFFPRLFARLRAWLLRNPQEVEVGPSVELSAVGDQYPLQAQVEGAAGFLKAIGLTEHFSDLVVICGHGSKTENNPFQSSLDCGACGGNTGYTNAQVAAFLLNQPTVRAGLRERGIVIPQQTCFIAALHQTTEDHLHFDRSMLAATHKPLLQRVQRDAARAGERLQQERAHSLPGQAPAADRAVNWAELIPEMALINNAAFVIAPRALTTGIDLGRRTFLHSYDPVLDEDGQILRTIMLGPVVVAHWISAQYYFSTTDPQRYGSGNKMLHNVIPGVGVMEGNLSDLKLGLPWQSVGFQDHALHQPLRLTVVVYAPKARVDQILNSEPQLSALFNGQWAHLRVLEP